MDARETALLVLAACERQGAWSDGGLKKGIREARLDSRDSALATRLCYGVLQNKLLLDFYLSHFSSVKPSKMEIRVLSALRLGVYQLLFMDKIPASAAITESVSLARKHSKNPKAAGLVNAVLRAVVRNLDTLPQPEGTTAQRLSIQYSHPLWLTETFLSILGEEGTEALLKANNRQPPTVAQVNTLKTTADRLQAVLEADGVSVTPHPTLANCLFLSGTGDLERLDSFRDGLFYVQDAAARMAVMAAGPKAGDKVLDLCAAPGGKSFAAALAMENRGEIVSCDLHPHKKELIEKGAARLGISILTAHTSDAREPRPEWNGQFDVVIADVPCSGLGIIRKKPDIREKDPKPLAGLPGIQREILSRAADYVRPGGVLLYATCTLLPRENEDVVRHLLEARKDFHTEEFLLPEPVGKAENGMTTLWPHIHDTDGFFIAKLRRQS